MSDLENWKERLDLTDEDILTQEHLSRVATQGPAQESEIIYCACGCGGFWLRPVGQKGRRRFIRGHTLQKRKRRTRLEIVKMIFDALPVQTFATIEEISKKSGVDWGTCKRYLGVLEFELGINGPKYGWLETVTVGANRGYRRVHDG